MTATQKEMLEYQLDEVKATKGGGFMTDAFRFFLECINLFFTIYLIGYSSFLFCRL